MTKILFIPLYDPQNRLGLFAKIRQPESLGCLISDVYDQFQTFRQQVLEATGLLPGILGLDLPSGICHINWRSPGNCPVWLLPTDHNPVVIDEDLVADTSTAELGQVTNTCFQLFQRPDREPYIRLEASFMNRWHVGGLVKVSLLQQLAGIRLNPAGDDEVARISIPRRRSDADRS